MNFLLDNFDGLTTSIFYKTLRKKDIKINDKRISENCLLRTGDDVKIYVADDFLYKKLDIPIVYQDNNIVIILSAIFITMSVGGILIIRRRKTEQ